MKILCTICARGGSEGLKNKNIRRLKGKPLIAHSINQAKKSGLFKFIVVSSDSKKIRDTAIAWGADHVIDRPSELASSTAAKLPAIQHAFLAAENHYNEQFDILIDLDATSPLRTIDDIRKSLDLFLNNPLAKNLVTAYPSRHSPYFNMLEVSPTGFVKLSKETDIPVVRRQDVIPSYDMNGSIYIWKRDNLLNSTRVIEEHTLLYNMPRERSIDIDSLLDWKLVSLLAKDRVDL